MEKPGKPPSENRRFPNYGRTAISGLKKSRKGKHHGLLMKIMDDLRKSQSGYAVTVPLASIGGIPVLNLRSAIVRAASKEGINISTSSDDESFYVWKA
jgi:hypothetical protein